MNKQKLKALLWKYVLGMTLPVVALLLPAEVACASAVPADGDNWMIADTLTVTQLGDTLSNVLLSPDTVRCYRVVYKEKPGASDVIVYDSFVRDTMTAVLDQRQVAVLQFMLLTDQRNYMEDSIRVKSPYRPIAEFEFTKTGLPTVSVIVSPSDHQWQIKRGEQTLWYNYADEALVARYVRLLLNIKKKKGTR